MSAGAGGRRLHLTMPPGLENFSRFKDLPYDIRHKIWSNIIFTAGIHFLKFERNEVQRSSPGPTSADRDGSSDDQGSLPGSQNSRRFEPEKTVKKTAKEYTATLSPIFQLAAADMSYYITKSKALAQLSLSCNEAAYEVERVTSKSDNLTLDNGRLIALANSSDIICIDYPDLLSTRSLGSWARNLNTSQLSKIRRLAVRYQPSWDEERRMCRTCGRYHEVLPGSHKEQAPRQHLYEFAALFPNLEAFYFIDHLIVRRPTGLTESEHSDPRWLGPSDRAKVLTELSTKKWRAERFKSGGRTYFEIDRELCRVCKVHSHVFNMLEWVQENYVAFCEKKGPKKHRNPRGLKFAVLACEWDHDRMVADKKQHQPSFSKRGRKKNVKRIVRDEPEILEALSAITLEAVYRDFTLPAGLPVIFGDGGESKYEFTFRMK